MNGYYSHAAALPGPEHERLTEWQDGRGKG